MSSKAVSASWVLLQEEWADINDAWWSDSWSRLSNVCANIQVSPRGTISNFHVSIFSALFPWFGGVMPLAVFSLESRRSVPWSPALIAPSTRCILSALHTHSSIHIFHTPFNSWSYVLDSGSGPLRVSVLHMLASPRRIGELFNLLGNLGISPIYKLTLPGLLGRVTMDPERRLPK